MTISNVILITVDCLRADRLGYAGHSRQLTPHIDRLAEQSVNFRRAFATGPRTAESFPGILASTYPFAFNGNWKLPDRLRTLPQVLRENGYATSAFHSNPFLSANMGYDRGFDTFWDSGDKTPVTSKVGSRVMRRVSPDSALWRILRRLVRRYEAATGLAHYVRASEVSELALEWLRGRQSPFFLWLHFMDLHYPYAPPRDYLRQIRPDKIPNSLQADLHIRSLEDPASIGEDERQLLIDLYDAGLRYVDSNIGHLIKSLAQMNLLDNTILVLTADHGEEFLEHGQFGHGGYVHDSDGTRARICLYDELLHVPLLIRIPDESASPRNIDSLASLVDLPPTIVELSGVAPPDEWQGRSLAPLIRGDLTSIREGVYSEYAVRDGDVRYPVVAYRNLTRKYIHDGAAGNHELYDLETDPGEQHNLYEDGFPASIDLASTIERHLAQIRLSSSPSPDVELDIETIERLRNLGYID